MATTVRRYYSNTAQPAQLTAAIDATQTTISVSTVTGLPTSFPFAYAIERNNPTQTEVVEVQSLTGTTLTIIRGVDGTTARTHPISSTAEHTSVARDFDTANAHASSTSVSGAHGSVVQADVTSGYVDLANAQTIAGTKTFSSAITAAGTQFGGSASRGFYDDGTNIALRTAGTGDVYLQSNGGGSTYARFGATTSTISAPTTFSQTLTVTGSTALGSTLAVTGALSGAGVDTFAEDARLPIGLTGGGTVTFNASSELSWSQRLIAISLRSATRSYAEFTVPSAGTVIPVVNSTATSVTVNANGIPFSTGDGWNALYWVPSLNAYRISGYNGTTGTRIPVDWLLVAVRNGDTGNITLPALGLILRPGDSVQLGTYGTGPTNWVDRYSTQTIAGSKSFTSTVAFSAATNTGPVSVTYNAAVADNNNYGIVGITAPAGVNQAYYSMTAAGNTIYGIGMGTDNVLRIGAIVAGKAMSSTAARIDASGNFSTTGTITENGNRVYSAANPPVTLTGGRGNFYRGYMNSGGAS